MIYDFKTTNESAIEMAKVLKELGIKNYYFHLVLYDEKLQGVDPFKENVLSLEMKARITKEVRINLWYYLREIVRIKETGGFTRYKFHRGNLAQTYCFLQNIDIIEILPRQNGKTVGAVCNYSWLYNFACKNLEAIFSNKQYPDSQLNLKRLKSINEVLPSYLKAHINERYDTDNLSEKRIDSNNNRIIAVPSPKDPAMADKIGRGNTVACLWYDEFSFLKYNKIVFDASAFAYAKASEAAEDNGVPHSRIITTTPNKLDVPEGAYCYSLIQGALKFDEHWYDMEDSEVKNIIEKNSKNGFVFIQFSYQELGHDEVWFEKQCKLVNYDLNTIKREILLEWTLSGDGALYSEEQLEEVKKSIRTPIGSFYIKDTYRFLIYEKIYNARERNYIISIDIAAGGDNDNTVISIIDPMTYRTVASFKSNKIDTVELVEVLVELVEVYFNSGVLVPERNNMGISVIHMLLRTSIADRIYYEYKGQNKADGEEDEAQINSKKRNKDKSIKNGKRIRIYGIQTLDKNRKIMFDEILNGIINENPEQCNNDYLFDDIKALERDKKGKVQARSGLHDDAVMSYLIGLYMIFYGANTRKFIKRTFIGNNQEEDSTNEFNKKVHRNIKNLYNTTNNRTNKIIDDYRNKQNEIREVERITGINSDSRNYINQNNKKTKSRVNRNINNLMRMSKM